MKTIFLFLVLMCQLGFAQEGSISKTSTESASPTQIYIKMGEAQTKKSLLALPPLQFIGNPNASSNYQAIGAELFRVISNNLSVSTYFQFISQSAFLEDTSKTNIRPHPSDPNGFKFDTWKQIGAEFLIRASFSVAGDSVTLETYTYHVPRGTVVLGKKYRGPSNSVRRIAHTFCNDILEALTGKTGMYLSKVVAASDRGGGNFREIYVLDWDGANVQKVTNHKSITLSPAWSPDGTKIAYTAFVQRSRTKTRNADMFIYELLTGKRWLVSYRQGINSGANFAPDNENLFLTLSQSGTPDIYKMGIDGSLKGRITNGPRGAMNVEPAVSPDGRKIAFSSDRSGQPMVYVMNADGSNVKRITFAGKYNATPAWSPDGKKLAFAGWSDDHFDIFTVNADGSDMVRITSATKPNGKPAQNEDPTFSPDGRHIMYTSNRTGTSQIYISNLDGSEERRITADNFNYYKPKWSRNIE
jgi:TolB protein